LIESNARVKAMLKFILFIFASVVLAHEFRAESNFQCGICKKSVEHLNGVIREHNRMAVSMVVLPLSMWVDQEKETLMNICPTYDGADCSGGCVQLSQEMQYWDISELMGDARRACTRRGWCVDDSVFKNKNKRNQQELVDEINRSQTTWKAKVYPEFNRSSHNTVHTLGAIVDDNLRCKPKHVYTKVASNIPEEFDSVKNWPKCAKVIGDIRDQSNCGCCWAFGAVSAASDRLCIFSNATMMFPLSSQDMCFCGEFDGCSGGMLFSAWAYIKSDGIVTGGQFNATGPFGSGYCSDFSLPHCHHHGPQGDDPYPAEGEAGCPAVNKSPDCPKACTDSAKSPHNDFQMDKVSFDGVVMEMRDEENIQTSIMTDGPMEAAFTVYEDFENYVSGVYQHTTGNSLGGHAIRIVGWGTDNGVKYWKVANSWNPYWGENGYFRILRGSNHCGIESQVTATSAGAVWSWKSGTI